jgi:PleD family two-component response regulator
MADAISQATKPVLVVDDQSTARTILREILLSLGYQVVEAATAEAAIEYIANQSFCLVSKGPISGHRGSIDPGSKRLCHQAHKS